MLKTARQTMLHSTAMWPNTYCLCLVMVQNLVLDQEFHVLGQQKLSDLRDKIVCVADYVDVGDFSDNPNCQSDILTKVSTAFSLLWH